MKIKIGTIVTVRASQVRNNGADCAPAIVTRIHSYDTDTGNGPVMVNATALIDLGNLTWTSSVSIYDSYDDAKRSGQFDYCGWIERDPLPVAEPDSTTEAAP